MSGVGRSHRSEYTTRPDIRQRHVMKQECSLVSAVTQYGFHSDRRDADNDATEVQHDGITACQVAGDEVT